MITVTLELSPECAAGLKRFADKVTYSDAKRILYPHVKQEIRDEQAYAIIDAFSTVEKALAKAGVRDWPWIETGQP